jgi:hypothetical protein
VAVTDENMVRALRVNDDEGEGACTNVVLGSPAQTAGTHKNNNMSDELPPCCVLEQEF